MISLRSAPERCRRTHSVQALIWVLIPGLVARAPRDLIERVTGVSPEISVWICAALLALGGAFVRPGRVWPRLLVSLVIGLWTASTLATLGPQPMLGFVILIVTLLTLTWIWPDERLRRFDLIESGQSPDQDLWAAALMSLGLGLYGWGVPQPSITGHVALALTCLAPAALVVWQRRLKHWGQRVTLAVMGLLGAAPLLDLLLDDRRWAPLALLAPLLMVIILTLRGVARRALSAQSPGDQSRIPGLWDALLVHPSRFLVSSFLALSFFGTVALALPVSSAGPAPLRWIDAAFTSVSATCVTGLAVVDTPTALSGVGQGVVLILIQLGGLGVMVFSAAAMILLGRRLSLSYERTAADTIGASDRAGLASSARSILKITFITEAAAALVLTLCFISEGDGVGVALWRGVFTAISAFCNAGFALQSDSLVGYAGSPLILGTVSLCILIGGLGPAVLAAFALRKQMTRLPIHVRLVLWMTALLVIVPAVLIALWEWEGALGGLSAFDKLTNALFQSITLRTAGFNSVDLVGIRGPTWTLMILTMIVGGSPGSTAGGIKTTTAAVVALAVLAAVRRRTQVTVFGRTLPIMNVLRAIAVTLLTVVIIFMALLALQLTQGLSLEVALFETVSALATVGLSIGGTGGLDEVGRIIIIFCMFAGRVGQLTLFVFLTANADPIRGGRYPEEAVPIG